MKYSFLSVCTLGAIITLLPFAGVHATSGIVIISEVSIAGEKASDEFIELYNTSDAIYDLSGHQLRRRTQSGSESSLKVFAKNTFIPAHGHFLWANSQGIYKAPLADAEISSSTLANDNSVGFFTASGNDGVLLDSLAWGAGAPFSSDAIVFSNPPKGTALTRDTTTREWSASNLLTPTNSHGVVWTPPTPEPILLPVTTTQPSVRLNEILANPLGDDGQGEFIELYNESDVEVRLDGFRIKDASKTGEYVFPAGTVLRAREYFLLPRSISQIALNNSDETIALFDPNLVLIDKVQYENTKEGVSYNNTGNGWRGGTPTPGSLNQLNTLPETREKVPKKGYRGIPVTFDARGTDTDGDTLKYTWDFGNNRKNYKSKTSHTYQQKGTYQVTLTTSDGSDDVKETFTLVIESPPTPEIRITALVPNPSGSDTDVEWIRIENRGKKAIDLKGFGIATGWKKLVNHPIRESLVIKPGKSATLTRKHARFTLHNQKSKIELRSPSGSVLQTIKYKLDQAIAEDAVYFKEKGQRWDWQAEETPVTPIATPPTDQPAKVPPAEVAPTVPVDNALPETDTPSDDAPDQEQVLGASIVIPDTTTENPSTEEPSPMPEPITTPSFVDWFHNFFANVNAWLNNWQNTRYDT